MTEQEMRDKITKYRSELDYVIKKITEVNYEVKFGTVTENTVDYLNTTLDDHFKNLLFFANEILHDVDKFSKDVIGIDREEINTNLDDIKRGFKNLKNGIKERYNRDVMVTSKKLEELKNNSTLQEETKDLFVPSLCTKSVKDYRTKLGFDELNYKELNSVNEKIQEINDKLQVKYDEEVLDFETGLEQLSILVAEIDNDMLSINNIETNIKKDDLENSVMNVKNIVSELEIKLANLKDRMEEEVYNNYFASLKEVYSSVKRVDKELDSIQVKVYDDQVKGFYNYLKNEILETEIELKNYHENILMTFEGYFDASAITVIENKLKEFDEKIEKLRNSLENAKKDGTIDEQLYNNLNNYLSKTEKTLDILKTKKDDPKTYKESAVTTVVGINMDGLESAIVELEGMVDSSNAPIKKDERRNIEKKINDTLNKIKAMEIYLEENKDEKLSEKLEEYKERLNKVTTVYRKKCPFLVKSIKSAKDFYKKHKKVALIAAGLATMALIHATLGPVIIPAIMQGNMMLGFSSPALRGFANVINNVLGGFINATKNSVGIWTLANGVTINPSVASTSLLKGIALSCGSTVLGASMAIPVAKMVVEVKNLVKKMNMATLKEKLNKGKTSVTEGTGKVKSKVTSTAKKTKEKINEASSEVKNKVKNTVAVPKSKAVELVEETKRKHKLEQRRRELIKMLKDSKMSLEEFVKSNEGKLSKSEIGLLAFYSNNDENEENVLEEGKKR